MKNVSRRGFLNSASVGLGSTLGAAALGASSCSAESTSHHAKRLPREVWIASITQNDLWADNHEQMTDMLIGRMQEVVPLNPDIICLPEISPFSNLSSGRREVAEIAEKSAGPVKAKLAEFARAHECYLWCPIYTAEDGRFYNALVLIDRQGKEVGEYRKMHPTVGECDNGISPGPTTPPVFQTDFGKIGAQICFDIEWLDGWRQLHQAGTEIVFWASAFGGGKKLNMLAGMYRYNIVSSTIKDVSQICDISGETLALTGRWQQWLCAPVNLERAYLHSWPFYTKFDNIRKKYGRAIRFTTYHEEEWTIVESRSPDLKVKDVLKEFDIKTYDEVIEEATARQEQMRG
ncbi:nitrilase-related carbon-nitrogen hydrolase [Gemmatimonadota bacterium]